MILRTIILIMSYVDFIADARVYSVLTFISEVCNMFRVIPIVLIAKIIIDTHREFIKVVLFTGIK